MDTQFQPNLQPDIIGRITTLATANYRIEAPGANKYYPFLVCNQGEADVVVTIFNQKGIEVSDVVLPKGRFFEAAIYGLKKDTDLSSIDLLIGQ